MKAGNIIVGIALFVLAVFIMGVCTALSSLPEKVREYETHL